MITEEFKKTFTNLVEGHEGNKLKIYDDGFGVPTIGIGFALINKVSGEWKAYPYKSLHDKGINLTEEHHKIIEDYADAKTSGKDISDLRNKLNDIDITINPETARKLLQYSIQHKYKIITSTIGEDKWDQLNLAQQVGVMDHAFQRGNILSLKESLVAGDYATTAKIMREVPKDNKSLKHRADIRADFVEHGKMEFDGIHIVQAGDTASRIAKSSGISLRDLKEFNPDISNIDKISVGQKIRITPPVQQDDKDDTVSMAAAGASNIDLPSTSKFVSLDEMWQLKAMGLQLDLDRITLTTPKIDYKIPEIIERDDSKILEKYRIENEERQKALESKKELEMKKLLEMAMKNMGERIQQLNEKYEQEEQEEQEEREKTIKQNRIIDLKNRVLDKISTKFEKLVEDIKAKIKKDYEEERANINTTIDLQSKILDVEKQTSNAQASCEAMAQKKQAEHDHEAQQELSALKAALAPGESLNYVSTAIQSRKQAELDAFRAAQEAQLKQIRLNIVDEMNKSLKEYEERAAQIQAKVDAKNEKVNTIAQGYDKRIHKFVENTSRYIAENFDDNCNVERIIE